ncbi:MAG: 2-succinyl-5-enolpyruvyl-6-hydroxy-3-cyclohexene-1-carboxylic-acid synthase [Verrucomicrobia bacterium]|nr:2-succinyl-5-enolpyruvyl-6-hydroxy-3-cyclohexene-1-carboxylic-acid synthase [Verrucomicrobiota bacterium]
MSTDTGSLNLTWSNLIIDQLLKQGVRYFCLGAGSRSTPLALAIADHPDTQHLVHFDERGVGFHALGFSKASGLPSVIVVTSGTAVANLFPAIMEASNERVPLILLTSDRPHELRDCGANQTCDQIKLFSDYVRWQVDLPCPTTEISERFVATTIAQAVFRSKQGHPGPVHLNCPFREPLFSLTPPSIPEIPPTYYETTQTIPSISTLEQWAESFQDTPKGIIVVGSLPARQKMDPIFQLASILKWPILPDILSQARSSGYCHVVIRHYDALLKADPSYKPDLVLHLGDRFVSKTLAQWLKTLNCPYFQVSDHPCRQDPDHLTTHRLSVDPSLFCKEIIGFVEERFHTDWFDSWKNASDKIADHLSALIDNQPDLTEPAVARTLSNSLSPSWSIFIGSSMPIRDSDQFLFPKQPIGPIFGNRGVSGIDGNIATAIGIAQGRQQPTFALFGDLAFLHDLNSLAQLRQAQYPVVILVINNHGGAIFSFLPIAQRKDVIEEFFVASHPYNFQNAAELFQIPYFRPHNTRDWEQLFSDLLANPCSAIVEIQTRRSENLLLHQEIQQSVLKCLNMTHTAT